MQRTQFAQTFANLAKLAASVWPRNWRDVDGPAEDGRGGVVEPVPQPVGGQAAAAFGEQEVGWSAEPGMGRARWGPRRAIHSSRAARVAASSGTVRSVASLPSGTFQQAAVAGPVPHAVQLEVEPCSRVQRRFTLTYS
jgi:hypothetical protein